MVIGYSIIVIIIMIKIENTVFINILYLDITIILVFNKAQVL